eukprot:GEMP01006859.1.p1 GENE.GEMP01006859.1~~GEMP01006859.1.p1  ORF type:complete len:1173 (+),score=267.15 GEMP01006859.1:129-3647(+)
MTTPRSRASDDEASRASATPGEVKKRAHFGINRDDRDDGRQASPHRREHMEQLLEHTRVVDELSTNRPPKLNDPYTPPSGRTRQGKDPYGSPVTYARPTEQIAPRPIVPSRNPRSGDRRQVFDSPETMARIRRRQEAGEEEPQRDAEEAEDPDAARALLRHLIDQLDDQVDVPVSPSSASFSSEELSSARPRIPPETVPGEQPALGEAEAVPGTVGETEVTGAVRATGTEALGVIGTAATVIPPAPPPPLVHVRPAWTGGPAKEMQRMARSQSSTQSSLPDQSVSGLLVGDDGLRDTPSLMGESLPYVEAREIDRARPRNLGQRVAIAVPLSVKAQFDQGEVRAVDLPPVPENEEKPPPDYLSPQLLAVPHDPAGPQFPAPQDPTTPQPPPAPIDPTAPDLPSEPVDPTAPQPPSAPFDTTAPLPSFDPTAPQPLPIPFDPSAPQPASAPFDPKMDQLLQAGELDLTSSRPLTHPPHSPPDLISPLPPSISTTLQVPSIGEPSTEGEPVQEPRPDINKMSVLADYHVGKFRALADAQKKGKRDRKQRKKSSVDSSSPSEDWDDDHKSLASARGTLVLGDERRSTLRVPSKKALLKKDSMVYAWQGEDATANIDIFIKKCRLWNGSAFHVEMGRLWQSDVVSGGLVSKEILPNIATFDIFRDMLFVAHDVVVGVFNMHDVLRGIRAPIALIVADEPVTTVHYSERFGALLIWDATKTPFFCDVCKLFPDVFPLCRQKKKRHKTLRGRVYGPQWFRHIREAAVPDGLSVMQTNFDNLNFDDSDVGSEMSTDSRATADSKASTAYSFLDAPTFYPTEPTCKLIVWGDHKRSPKERLVEYLLGVLREEQLKRRAKLLEDREKVDDDDESEVDGLELRMDLKLLLAAGIPAVHLKQKGQDRVLETVRGVNEVQQEKKKFKMLMEAEARAITYLYYRTLQQRNQTKLGFQVASVEKKIYMPRRIAVDTLGFDTWLAGEYKYRSGNHYTRLDRRVKLVWDGVSWRFKDVEKNTIEILGKQVASLPIGRVGPMSAVWPHILLISNLDDRKAKISEMERQHHKILEMNFRVAWKHYHYAKKMMNGEEDANDRLWKDARCVMNCYLNPVVAMDEPHEMAPVFRRYQDMKCEESLHLVLGRPLFVQDLDDRTIPANVHVDDDIIYLESNQDAQWYDTNKASAF